MNIRNFFFIIFFYFFYWTLLLLNVCSVTNANQRNQIASNKRNIPPKIKRSLQQSTFMLTNKITASNGGISDNFGNFNALAISNNRIVVGASGYNSRQGAAYLFMDPNDPESGRSYSQMAILLASDGVSGDWFGRSVDIDGDIIVVGASFDGPGAVYIYRIGDNENNISQMAIITAQNGTAYDNFGWSVAIHGNFILVGAIDVDKNGTNAVGSAYLYVNPSNDSNNQQWTQIMQFQPNDLTEGDWFGYSVAMEDDIAVIGTYSSDANAAYVFVPVNENVDSLSLWTQMAKLTGPTGSLFGDSVAVAGNTIVVGAQDYISIYGNNVGAVFVFTKIDGSSSSSWTQTNVLLAADGAEDDNFGRAVAISKDASTIVVGANWDDFNSTITDSGAAYLFRNSNTTTTTTTTVGWTLVGKYVADDRESNDSLGSSIAIEDSVVVVGAWGDNSYTGSVYILDTGNSSPPPPPTTTPITTTTAPTAEPVEPTVQPTTASSTTEPTSPPITNPPTTMAPDNNNSNKNPSLTPAPLTPTTSVPATSTPPNNNTASLSNPNESTTTSNNNIYIIIATIGGIVVVVVALGLGFFNYRLKRDRLRLLEQQQQQQPSSGNNGMAVVNASETPMADVIFPNTTQTTEDRTMPAEVVLLDLPPSDTPPPAAVGNRDVVDAEKGLPRYKDQARTTAPLAGPSHIPSSEQNRNSQKNGDREELSGTQYDQQQQQQLCDPTTTVNSFQERLPTYKDQVSGE